MTLSRLWSRPYLIEPADLDDAESLADLHEAAFPRGWSTPETEALIDDPNCITLLIRPDMPGGRRRPVGFIMLRMAGDEAEILTFAVGKAQRRHGFGARLLDGAMLEVRRRGGSTVFLEVDEGNEAALTLYRRRHFKVAGERPAYSLRADGTRGRALVMRRDLR